MLLTDQILPVMREISGEFFIFQQDSAPACTPSLRDNKPSGIGTPAFISQDHWFPAVQVRTQLTTEFGEICSSLYQSKCNDVDEQKQHAPCLARSLEQSVINDGVNEWRKRLRACIRAFSLTQEHF